MVLTKSSHLKTLLFIHLLLYSIASLTTEQNLRQFFKLTYDQNNDQHVTWTEFSNYFKLIEPDHHFAFDVLNSAFNAFDLNKDGKIRLEEFIDVSEVDIRVKAGHKQIHLGFTENENEMQVMWVSNPEEYLEPAVLYGEYPTKLNQIQKATIDTYNVGHFGFHGRIYRAVMKKLKPGKKYFYKVGDLKTRTFSQIKSFKSAPKTNQTIDQIRFAVFGDMGTYAPFGHLVSKMIANNNIQKPYDFVLLTGDIAYAGVSSQKKGQVQPIWDLFGEQSQAFASYTPFMVGVGNHEAYYNFTSYLKRYRLPRKTQNQTNLWFSFDFGQLHVVYFSSQHPYGKGTQQYNFLEEDLKKARQNPNTQWIILGTHRPFYSSDAREYAPITELTKNLEELINKYKVDIVQNGHQHCYERSWPVQGGKARKENHNQKYYINPDAPIYVVQGTAGALVHNSWVNPAPQWSLKRIMKYGYGQVTIKANYLKYEFISLPVGKIVDTWYIIKDKQNESHIDQ